MIYSKLPRPNDVEDDGSPVSVLSGGLNLLLRPA